MHWVILRLLGFQAWVVLLCLLTAIITIAWIRTGAIDDAYEREVRALRVAAIHTDPERRLDVEVRAQVVTRAVLHPFEVVAALQPQSTIGQAVADMYARITAQEYIAERVVRIRRFLPLMWIRLETYCILSLTCCPPLFALAYTVGGYHAKRRIRQGYHKRNALPHYVYKGFWLFRDLSAACMGVVVMVPVAWWVIPNLVVSALMVWLWRSYFIENR